MTDTTTGPEFTYAPAPKAAWYRKKTVQLIGAGVLGLVIGSAAGGSSPDTTPVTSSTEADARAEQNLDDLRDKVAEANAEIVRLEGEVATARQAQKTAEESARIQPVPAAPKPAAPKPAQAAGSLSDGDWTAVAPKLVDDGLGDFGGDARVTNTSGEEKSGSFTFSLFKGGELVGTLIGVASDVGAGETATVSLVSTDKFQSGVDKIEFQVDADF